MSPNGHDPSRSPVQYPSVTIQGVSYSLKWSNVCVYRLQSAGVDTRLMNVQLERGQVSFKTVIDLLCVCIERTPRFEPEQLCDLFDNPKAAIDLHPKLWEAMGKVRPPAEVKLQEPAAETPQLQ